MKNLHLHNGYLREIQLKKNRQANCQKQLFFYTTSILAVAARFFFPNFFLSLLFFAAILQDNQLVRRSFYLISFFRPVFSRTYLMSTLQILSSFQTTPCIHTGLCLCLCVCACVCGCLFVCVCLCLCVCTCDISNKMKVCTTLLWHPINDLIVDL